MKTISCTNPRFQRALKTAALLALLIARSGQALSQSASNDLAYAIEPGLGAAELAPGDAIAITSLRGNRPHLEVGGSYQVEGTYTLASAEAADLAWFATSSKPSPGEPIGEGELVKITKGSGTFQLTKTWRSEGWLHVSFYVGGQSHGGVYFGEKNAEATILRKKSWSDFARKPTVEEAGSLSPAGATSMTVTQPPNVALLKYLGDPVPAPADLDARYAPSNLLKAFMQVCKRADLAVQSVSVDDSEFPFLLYGKVAGKHDYQQIKDGLTGMKGYSYAGSVVGGSENSGTHFAINIVPYEQYPNGQAAACNRRLMLRLQMLDERARVSE